MTEQDDREEERRAGPSTEERVRLELVLFADLIQRCSRLRIVKSVSTDGTRVGLRTPSSIDRSA
jgi:hypothetical protein